LKYREYPSQPYNLYNSKHQTCTQIGRGRFPTPNTEKGTELIMFFCWWILVKQSIVSHSDRNKQLYKQQASITWIVSVVSAPNGTIRTTLATTSGPRVQELLDASAASTPISSSSSSCTLVLSVPGPSTAITILKCICKSTVLTMWHALSVKNRDSSRAPTLCSMSKVATALDA
jgi:hypothetical protein